MRKTKIVCTMGPSTDKPGILRQLMENGMNVARFNFSHGDYEEHKGRFDKVRALSKELDLPIACMLDTKGPEIRLGEFKNGVEKLTTGQKFTLTSRSVEGTNEICSVTYKELPHDVKPGGRIMLDDGLIELRIDEVGDTDIACTVCNDGIIKTKKGVNVPGVHLSMPYMSQRDTSDILFGVEQGFDLISASFARNAQDIMDIRHILDEHNSKIRIIAKIENRAGVDNIEDICGVCEGIMVARGDLGVEVPFTELPAIQKQLITTCRLLGTRVITATEMLESMIQNPRPTRAEISDVANAVYDGTSAIMLSGETAAGKYPVQAVETMAAIAEETEQHIHYETRFRNNKFQIRSLLDAISHATCGMAIDIGAKAIVVSSISGRTVRMVSRFRVPTDIVGMATSKAVWYKLALSWGVQPVLCEHFESTDVLFYHARKAAKQALHLAPGDRIVLTGGTVNGTSGNTNLIRVDTIQ